MGAAPWIRRHVRRPVTRAGAVLALAAALAVGASVSVAGAAKSNSFRDDFTTFDSGRWIVSSRPFGYGTLDPADVAVANGQLGIRLPGGTTNGGEMRSRSLYRFGTYRARLKVADAPSSLTAFSSTGLPTTSRRSTSSSSTTRAGASCSRPTRAARRRTP